MTVRQKIPVRRSHQSQTTKFLLRWPINIPCSHWRLFKFNDFCIILYWTAYIDILSIKIIVWILFFIIILYDGQPRFYPRIDRWNEFRWDFLLSALKTSNSSWNRYQGSSSRHNSKFRRIIFTSGESIIFSYDAVYQIAVFIKLIWTTNKPLLHMFSTETPVVVSKPQDRPH